MTDAEKAAEFARRHQIAQHAMQAGVAYEIARDDHSVWPKHLRVGINTAMIDHASLVKLLVKKGVITELEYLQAIAEGMEDERARYEERHGVTFV
ncbi:MAG: hypothetical protein WDM91_11080 [Rhizomicrobium sp.]